MEKQGANASNTTATDSDVSDGLTVETASDTQESADSISASLSSDATEDDGLIVEFEDADDFTDSSASVTGTVEVTDTLQNILNNNVSVQENSAAILPQKPDESDMVVIFED